MSNMLLIVTSCVLCQLVSSKHGVKFELEAGSRNIYTQSYAKSLQSQQKINISGCADDCTRKVDMKSKNLNQLSSQKGADKSGPFVDDYTTEIIMLALYCIVNCILDVLGISTNIINVIVFVRQGFDESINISLLSLSISDMCSLVAHLGFNILFSPHLQSSDISFVPIDVSYLVVGWPRNAFIRITAWITAFITFERCICIAMPLKVKAIFTPKRTVIMISSIYTVIIASIGPTYYTSRLVWRFFPDKNRSLLSLGFTPDRNSVDSISFALTNVCLPMLSFTIILVCTAVLILKLNSKAKWRKTSALRAENVSRKDKRAIKMVTFISGTFIFCFLPSAAAFAAVTCEPELNFDGKYRNAFIVLVGTLFFLESVNSCINILYYLTMSTKYKETFMQIIKLR